MWGSIANLKENLNRMALEIHDGDDDDDDAALSLNRNSGDRAQNSPVTHADRRISRNFSPSKSSIANGFDSAYETEVLEVSWSIGEPWIHVFLVIELFSWALLMWSANLMELCLVLEGGPKAFS